MITNNIFLLNKAMFIFLLCVFRLKKMNKLPKLPKYIKIEIFKLIKCSVNISQLMFKDITSYNQRSKMITTSCEDLVKYFEVDDKKYLYVRYKSDDKGNQYYLFKIKDLYLLKKHNDGIYELVNGPEYGDYYYHHISYHNQCQSVDIQHKSYVTVTRHISGTFCKICKKYASTIEIYSNSKNNMYCIDCCINILNEKSKSSNIPLDFNSCNNCREQSKVLSFECLDNDDDDTDLLLCAKCIKRVFSIDYYGYIYKDELPSIKDPIIVNNTEIKCNDCKKSNMQVEEYIDYESCNYWHYSNYTDFHRSNAKRIIKYDECIIIPKKDNIECYCIKCFEKYL
jgi:hypothetical protein